MRLERITIRNFRLLRRVSIDMTRDMATTILVGPNNTGKTSVMDILKLFTGKEAKRKLSMYDIFYRQQRLFNIIQKRLENTQNHDESITILKRFAPRIRLDLLFSYDEAKPEDLNVASELLMNLEEENNKVALRIEYSLENAPLLANEFENRRQKDENLLAFLKDKLTSYYSVKFFKVSEDGKQAISLTSGDIIQRLIKIDIIPAQRHVDDDDEASRAAKLSRLLHAHYNQYYKTENLDGFHEIEDAIKDSAEFLTQKYGDAFSRLITRLREFGYPQGQLPPNLTIKAEMNAETLYRDNTRIYYSNQYSSPGKDPEPFELPEKYNGLGYKNLIFIVLQLEAFRAAVEAISDDQPRVHIIAIEEPEVHLHPQMQCIFIREISRILDETAGGSTAQVLLSTHSSHIVADSGFDPIRYFQKTGNEICVKDLARLPLESNEGEVKPFLRRYMKLTHCDLFFADKCILVEGQVERLLVPLMLEKCANGNDAFKHLSRQYISVLEVGGAYAHKFKPLLDFIGIPTLIITDIDSVDTGGNKCRVADGVNTSNATLMWLPGMRTIADLNACDERGKTQRHIRIAYQIPDDSYCGRSFEEAFIYANLDWIKKNYSKLPATSSVIEPTVKHGLPDAAYELGTKIAKVDFALDLMTITDWNIPQYIAEGLEWLAQQGDA